MTQKNQFTDQPVSERFWPKVDRAGECWLWIGSRYGNGYGKFRVLGRDLCAHRYAYELLVGPIPDGLVIDHLCRNRLCVNPAHLEPVTQRTNLLRGNGWSGCHARQTHCIHGHEYTPENTIYEGAGRRCSACRRITDAAKEARRKAAVARRRGFGEG